MNAIIKTEKETYGAKGWVLHLLTDAYGYSQPNSDLWGFTPTGGAWMTFPLYEHYLFTCDKAYLKQIYPIIKGACDFFSDFLILSPEGYLVTSPSTSSENTYSS